MSDLNDVKIMGNLTRDPDLKYLATGMAVCEINVACNTSWYDFKAKEKKERVDFIEVIAFGKTAEVIGEHFKKGRKILVCGSIQQDRWEDKEGKKRSKTKVKCEEFFFCDAKYRQDHTVPAPEPLVTPDNDVQPSDAPF